MNVEQMLNSHRDLIIDEAYLTLERARATHYEAVGEPVTRQRLSELFTTVVEAVATRDLSPAVRSGARIAQERFHAGFDLGEVQVAFNALEDAMWRRLVAAEPPAEVAASIGLLSTVLGAAKDALARTYVALASHRHAPAMDVAALFQGATS